MTTMRKGLFVATAVALTGFSFQAVATTLAPAPAPAGSSSPLVASSVVVVLPTLDPGIDPKNVTCTASCVNSDSHRGPSVVDLKVEYDWSIPSFGSIVGTTDFFYGTGATYLNVTVALAACNAALAANKPCSQPIQTDPTATGLLN